MLEEQQAFMFDMSVVNSEQRAFMLEYERGEHKMLGMSVSE
jgi:hypothetical protein